MTEYGGLPDSAPRFGTGFNYALWTAGTELTFHNVPWTSDYRDIVRFESRATLDEYLHTVEGEHGFTLSSYAKAYETVRIGLPFNAVYGFNYLRVHNPAMPVGNDVPFTFYYFIKDIRFIAPETTEIVVQLDVWQTFCWTVEFGNCYIERGHVGVANERAFEDYGRNFLTVPEGFDVGNEYYIETVYEHRIADNGVSNPDDPMDTRKYHVLVWSATDIAGGEYGDTTAPNLQTAAASKFENLPNGTGMLWFTDPSDYAAMAQALKRYPWISQGILTVMIVPPFTLPDTAYEDRTVTVDGIEFGFRYVNSSGSRLQNKLIVLQSDWRDTINLPDRYRHLDKFKVYPYMAVELTTYMGTPLLLKPENMPESDFKVMRMEHYALPSPRLAFVPWRYNGRAGYADGAWDSWVNSHDHAEFLDMVTGIINFPTFSIVNDQYRNYLASNANTIAYQYAQADWSQQRALTANQLGYEQATAGMDLQNMLTALGIGAANQSMELSNFTTGARGIVGAAGNGVQGVIGGAMRGGGLGAVAGGIAGAIGSLSGALIDINQTTQQTAISNALASSQNTARVGTSGFMRDTNKDFADFAARGDYAQAIAAINAKVQDAKLIQPTTAGQVGGEAFLLTAWKWALHAKVKRISPAAQISIGEFWLRYGYAVNRFGTPPASLRCMSNFTYWKMRETYLKAGPMPESYKMAIRGIFEKGVTVWTDPAVIGRVDLADNEPLKGVRL